jgi:hypothetical protein
VGGEASDVFGGWEKGDPSPIPPGCGCGEQHHQEEQRAGAVCRASTYLARVVRWFVNRMMVMVCCMGDVEAFPGRVAST